jgi:hypothetical protein
MIAAICKAMVSRPLSRCLQTLTTPRRTWRRQIRSTPTQKFDFDNAENRQYSGLGFEQMLGIGRQTHVGRCWKRLVGGKRKSEG